ncbi:MAG: acyl-CoA dehydrogenase family protein [Polyangiaceae bacterium]
MQEGIHRGAHAQAARDGACYAKETWAKMGELGWLSVLFPEEMGGLGGSFTDAALIIEQLGTTLVPEPYIASVVLAGLAIRYSVSDEEGAEILAPLIDGSAVFALAYTEEQSRHDVTNVTTRAEKSGDGYKLTGKKRWVLAGHGADKLVVSARTSGETRDRDGVSLFLVDANAAGVKRTRVDMMDGHKAAMIDLEGADARLLGEAGKAAAVLEQVMDYGAAAACAEGAGIMQTVLGMTRNYLCEREQFGMKIGTFQALQHRTVDMFVETQLAKSSAIMAMIKADDADPAERSRDQRSQVSARPERWLRGAPGDSAPRRHRRHRRARHWALLQAHAQPADAVRRRGVPHPALRRL